MKLAHSLDQSHPVHLGMEYMAERVKELSDGKLQIRIYASGQLGTERECLELLQIGSLGMTKVSAALMEGFLPVFRVFSLPYIFANKEHAHAVFDGEIGQEFLLASEEILLRGLTFYDAGSRSFYTKDRPILTPEDLRGLKIRVMPSNTSFTMIRMLGGSPTPISWGELYTALQGGVVDGAENNPPSFYLSHHYEVCRYYSLNEHTTIPDILVISTIIWNTLTQQEQEWLQQAATESAAKQRILWEESELKSLRAVEAAGVQIFYPDKEPFARMVEPMYELYKDHQPTYDMIKRIKALKPQIVNNNE